MRRREEGRWTVVQPRKNIQAKTGNLNVTSFFVAGFSDSTKIVDLRRCFEVFGNVVDVYMGKNKDEARRNYAFVKFSDVQNVRSLEGELQGVVCGGKTLSVNAAKYGRDRAPTHAPSHTGVNSSRGGNTTRHVSSGVGNQWMNGATMGPRSFA